jgi:hypothetical protein
LILALRATFLPEAVGELRAGYQLNLGDAVVHARIDQGSLEVGEGPLAGADLVIETGPAIRALLSGELSPGEAVQTGSVRLTGDADLLTRFVEAFHIPPAPVALPL